MTAKISDGRALAKKMRGTIAKHVAVMSEDHGIQPGLAVVLVGDDPASALYVANKKKAADETGMRSIVYHLPKKTSQDAVLELVGKLNRDKKIHGILIQMPLPKQIDTATVLRAISPLKDVDGLHVENVGRLASGLPGLVPCTPMGCVMLIKQAQKNISGLHAVIIGRSNLVGKPLAQLLLRENCTVTIAHSRTENIASVAKQGDIVIAAVGKAEMVKRDWIKPGAIVIDVGINRAGDGIVGDVDFTSVSKTAGHITPVPGGVGPMTIACLLANTITAACRQYQLTIPEIKA